MSESVYITDSCSVLQQCNDACTSLAQLLCYMSVLLL